MLLTQIERPTSTNLRQHFRRYLMDAVVLRNALTALVQEAEAGLGAGDRPVQQQVDIAEEPPRSPAGHKPQRSRQRLPQWRFPRKSRKQW